MSEQTVVCETIEATNGALIGRIQLNKPKALNAIDLPMVNAIDAQLRAWQEQPEIACVILDASGEKAFCAGGDVVSMYKAMQQEPGKTPQFLKDFFTAEYQLDYRIHSYPKPIIVWGKGIVMGGGLGLFNGASHRVVLSDSRIAMPEITIGLYPDVGGSWFLNKMPGKVGLFLGLTGANINASDALYTKLADHFLGATSLDVLTAELKTQSWPTDTTTSSVQDCHRITTNVLAKLEQENQADLPQSELKLHQQAINQACSKEDIATVVDAIAQMPENDSKWLSRAKKGLKSGSPITAHIVFEQLHRGKSLSLADCFRMELDLSCRCGEFGEFAEGVRALLIDKDMQPNWKYKTVAAVPSDVIEWYFTSPWTAQQHPLRALGE